MNHTTALAILVCAGALCSACQRQPEPTESASSSSFQLSPADSQAFDHARAPVALKDQGAIAFAKATVLHWRSHNYSAAAMSGTERRLPRPLFARYTDDQVGRRLFAAHQAMFGNVAAGKPVDRGDSIGLDIAEGIAWVAKDSGAITLRRPGHEGISTVSGAEHAVELAATQVAALGLIRLSEHESLDLVGVSATMTASWDPQPDGSMTPVPVHDPSLGKDVAEYVSEHTVIFGRRYRGVPIEGGTLKAVLDAKGSLVGLLQEWRDIAGESPEGVVIDEEQVIESRRDPETLSLSLRSRVCGYFEDSFVGTIQESPGVGCMFKSIVPGEIGIGRLKVDFVTMTSDPSMPLSGKPLSKNQ